jgi:hypothetical protein
MRQRLSSITLLGCAITLFGCAGWQVKTTQMVDKVERSAMALENSSKPLIDSVCKSIIADCTTNADTECKAGWGCVKFRQHIETLFVSLHLACADVQAAVAIGNQTEADKAAASVIKLLNQIRQQLREVGILL